MASKASGIGRMPHGWRLSAVWLAAACIALSGCARPIGSVFDGEHVEHVDAPCQYLPGEQGNASWTNFRGCPSHAGYSRVLGPRTPVVARAPVSGEWTGGVALTANVALVLHHGGLAALGPGGLESPLAMEGAHWELSQSYVFGWPAQGPDGVFYAYGADGLMAVAHTGEHLWTAPNRDPDRYYGAPVVGPDGTIYASNTYRLVATSADGSHLWESQWWPHIEIHPMVGVDGRVYVAGGDIPNERAHGTLLAFTRDGNGVPQELFKRPSEQFTGMIQAPDSTLYIRSIDDIYGEAPLGRLHAVTPEGEHRWTFRGTGAYGIYPALGPDGTIFAGGGGEEAPHRLFGITPDGEQRWVREIDGSLDDFTSGNSAVDGSGLLYVGVQLGESCEVRAYESDGEERFRFPMPSPARYARVWGLGADGALWVYTDAGLYLLREAGTTAGT